MFVVDGVALILCIFGLDKVNELPFNFWLLWVFRSGLGRKNGASG